MSYRATVIKVMIASPNDVPKERQLVRDVIHEWNAVHSEKASVVLMPVGWETHASPLMGSPPQAIINDQVLQGCDLLIATFWTRLGSPTDQSPSGTVEEIRKHLEAGKPAMIYFSSAPVRPDSIDENQYGALKRFRDECLQQGLVESYDSLSQFREKFARQLAQTVIRNFANEGPEQASEVETILSQPQVGSLSDIAKELLIATSEDKHGMLMALRCRGGLVVQASGRQLGEEKNPRSEAALRAGIDELCHLGFLEPRGHKGESFGITQDGYDAADRLTKEGS